MSTDSWPEKVKILDVGISAMTMDVACDQMERWIADGDRQYVSVCTVHTVMECQNLPEMMAAVNGAAMATPDGMPLAWLAGMRSTATVGRVYGPDLFLEMCRRSAEHGYRHYFYGGKEGVPEELAAAMQSQFPGLEVAGAYSPPFRALTDDERSAVLDEINASGADIVWVGLGTPKQDLWMAENRDGLEASVLVAVGAAFDFHTGRLDQAPRWMMNASLEWLYRLMKEPRRLWYRYLVYNPLFVFRVMLESVGLRRPADDSS